VSRLNDFDILIVGGGPAGLSAAIYLVRAGYKIRVFEKERVGGLLWNAHRVENYLGFPGGIGGAELATRFQDQALSLGVIIDQAKISRLRESRDEPLRGKLNRRPSPGLRSMSNEGGFIGAAGRKIVRASAVIVASGTRPKHIRLPGCSSLLGRRVFFEIASAEADRARGRKALVIGGGDAAFDYAIQWRERGGEAEILVRSKIRGLSLLAARAARLQIPVLCGAEPLCVTATPSGIRLSFRHEMNIHQREGDILFLACGREPDLECLDDSLRKMIRKPSVKTRCPGLFWAGDVIRGRDRQTGIAVGDGLRAAMEADAYLQKARGRTMTTEDGTWRF